MASLVSFDDYRATLGRLTTHVDPGARTPASDQIKDTARSLADMSEVSAESLANLIMANPSSVPVLGLVVGLPQEKLRNALRHAFDTTGWSTLARDHPRAVVEMLDREFDPCPVSQRAPPPQVRLRRRPCGEGRHEGHSGQRGRGGSAR